MRGERWVTPITGSRPHYTDAIAGVTRGLYSVDPMPWQRHVARLQTEMNPDGSWAYRTIIVSVPRQAGKTTLRGPIHIHRCLTRRFARTWLTAQTRQDARDIVVEEVGRRFQLSPLASLGKLRESQGSEGVYFTTTTGSSMRVFAPQEGGLDGKANELVDVDEGWKIDPATGAALDNSILPTMLTTGGQFGMVSTAGNASSTWLKGYVDQGRAAVDAGVTEGVAIVDCGIPPALADYVRELLSHGSFGDQFDQAIRILAEHHPAYGYTLRLDALAAGVRAMLANPKLGGVDGVVRAYGNHWNKNAETLIPLAVFDRAPDAPDRIPEHAALAVAVGVDDEDDSAAPVDTVVLAVWRDHTGRPHTRVIDHVPGVAGGPAAYATASRGRRWGARACAGAGPVLEVVDTAERLHGVRKVTRLTARDYATSCAQTLTLLLEQLISHDHHPALRSAVENAARRRVDDGGWAWSRKDSAGSIAALEALSVGLYAFDHRAEWEEPEVL